MAWFRSRNVRKFFRSRSAVVALLVIGAYALVGLSVAVFGLITLEETKARVAAKNIPGFFREMRPEKRLEVLDYYLALVLRADEQRMEDGEPNAPLKLPEIEGLTPRQLSHSELEEFFVPINALRDELAESPDLDVDESAQPKLDELEKLVNELLPYPSGRAGTIRDMQLLLGTDKQGRSIFLRAVYSIKVAIQIGVVTAFISVLVGAVLGCAAGYFGGWVDHFVIWLYTTFSSVPGILLLVLVAYIAGGIDVSPLTDWIYETTGGSIDWTDFSVSRSLLPVYVAFCITFWIGPCRVIRGETLKIKELEYVQAANAAGFGQFYIMFRHILPNASHLMLINFSLLFIGAIKSEVILSFLGLGVQDGPSWGIMIAQSDSEVIRGFFWQIGAATVFMFGLVLAFNVLSDALQDVFDPKHL